MQNRLIGEDRLRRLHISDTMLTIAHVHLPSKPGDLHRRSISLWMIDASIRLPGSWLPVRAAARRSKDFWAQAASPRPCPGTIGPKPPAGALADPHFRCCPPPRVLQTRTRARTTRRSAAPAIAASSSMIPAPGSAARHRPRSPTSGPPGETAQTLHLGCSSLAACTPKHFTAVPSPKSQDSNLPGFFTKPVRVDVAGRGNRDGPKTRRSTLEVPLGLRFHGHLGSREESEPTSTIHSILRARDPGLRAQGPGPRAQDASLKTQESPRVVPCRHDTAI